MKRTYPTLMLKNRILKLSFTALISAIAITNPIAKAEFFDVYEDDPLYNQIRQLEIRGIITPNPLENFNPEQKITRAEFIEMVVRSLGVEYNTPAEKFELKDVQQEDSKANYIYKALELGLIKPSNGNVFPSGNINKVQALDIGLKAEGVNIPIYVDAEKWNFKDLNSKSSFAPLVQKAVKIGILENSEYIKPFSPITKREAVGIIYTLLSDDKIYNNATVFENIDTSQAKLNIYNTELDQEDIPEIDIFLHVYDQITQDYFEQNEVNNHELITAAIKGMVSTLSDPYTVYSEPNGIDIITSETLQDQIVGIGVEISEFEGEITVISPIKGGPADLAGIKPFDIIKKANGQDLSKLSALQASKIIKGKEGSSLELLIFRPSENREIVLNIKRAAVEIPSVTLDYKNDIAIISISLFRGNSIEQFREIAEKLAQNKPKGIILDLRGNSGGYLEASTEISSQFLELGDSIASMIDAKGNEIIYFSVGPSLLSDIPTIVLIDQGSASASEIIAGALQDNGQATIIGDKSFGKGSVQSLYAYYNGSEFKITVAKWFTPKGNSIDKLGITPDIKIENTLEALRKGADAQLLKAIEILN